MLTPKRLAAALRDMPPSTTAPTTRSRRSSESAISAASFARRQSSSRSKAIRESLPRFNSLGDRSSALHRELWTNPRSVADVNKRLSALSSRLSGSLKKQAAEGLDQWFEGLP